jgi:hypothetical protein
VKGKESSEIIDQRESSHTSDGFAITKMINPVMDSRFNRYFATRSVNEEI